MEEIIDLAMEDGIHSILVQRQIDMEMATAMADEIHGRVDVIDPLAYDWITNMREIARTLNRTYQP